MRLSSNMIGNANDGTNFPHRSLLTNIQVANLRKAFANFLSTDIKLSKPNYLISFNQEDFLVDFLVHY